MEKKIDNRLQDAVNKGYKKKQAQVQKEYDERRAKKEEHEKEMKKYLPKARKWVNEQLFNLIAEQESKGSNTLIVSEWVDGIPMEVAYKLIQKIDGLSIWSQEDVTWEDSDFGKFRERRYYIQWKSADPNLNRNDR